MILSPDATSRPLHQVRIDLETTWAHVVLGPVGRTALIVLVAILTRLLVHRLVDRVADQIARGRAGLTSEDDHESATVAPAPSRRREQRARTMAGVLRSITSIVVVSVAVLMVLPLYGFSVTALVTSAGILGVALGFGAQALVKDFLSGMFLIAEDQFGVGDVVDLGSAIGVVEAVGLRVTRLRDLNGTIWYLRNGEILRVGNHSQGWSRTVMDIGVAYGEDLGRVQDLLRGIAEEIQQDPSCAPVLLQTPQVWGIESVSAEEVVLRLVVKTKPLGQWEVARELRARVKDRFDAEGIGLIRVSSRTQARQSGGDAGGSIDEELELPEG